MYSRRLTWLIFVVFMAFISCSKDKNNDNDIFYGSWKTSYGDTLTFSRFNKKDIVDFSSFGAFATADSSEFDYRKGKLYLRELIPINGSFRKIESFNWTQTGKEFTVTSTEWFAFMSALSTFTFTKIP